MDVYTADVDGYEMDCVRIGESEYVIKEDNGVIRLILMSDSADPHYYFEKDDKYSQYSLEGKRVLYFDHLRSCGKTLCLGKIDISVSEQYITTLVRWEDNWYICVDDEPSFVTLIKLPNNSRPLINNLSLCRSYSKS